MLIYTRTVSAADMVQKTPSQTWSGVLPNQDFLFSAFPITVLPLSGLISSSAKPSYFQSLKLADRDRFGIRVLYGVELNIINTAGDVDLDDEILSALDYAIISIHPPIFKPYHDKDLSSAYIRAMDHPKVRFLGHIDDARFPVDFEYLLEIAKEKHVYPEINNGSLMPDAYRINGQENCRRILSICKKLDLPVLLSSDSHGKKNIGNMQYIFPLLEELDFPAHLVLNSDLSVH